MCARRGLFFVIRVSQLWHFAASCGTAAAAIIKVYMWEIRIATIYI